MHTIKLCSKLMCGDYYLLLPESYSLPPFARFVLAHAAKLPGDRKKLLGDPSFLCDDPASGISFQLSLKPGGGGG